MSKASIQQVGGRKRFWHLVEKSAVCWRWLGSQDRNGYGLAHSSLTKRSTVAHRVAYELTVGPIPDGMTLDHICRNRICVNPLHLRVCTQRENVHAPGARTPQAINSAKTHCLRGHEFTEANTRVRSNPRGAGLMRSCKTCQANARNARRRVA